MSQRKQRIRTLDTDEFAHGGFFSPELTDPRNALNEQSRNAMIERRRRAGLSDYPERPLYPERKARFEPHVDPAQV